MKHSKCKLGVTSVTYLGHVLCGVRIKPKPDVVEAIRLAPSPSSKDDVRSFLGLTEFYSEYVRNFSCRVFKIRQLLKNKSKFVWDTECENEFKEVKLAIVKAAALNSFDPELTCHYYRCKFKRFRCRISPKTG